MPQTTPPVGFGVLGARSMVAELAVLPALTISDSVDLVASCSLGGPVSEAWSQTSVDDYGAVIDHPDVEVVYIPLPNGLHRTWVERCAAAGKHVLCEKPLAPTSADARAMQTACDDAGVLLAEAWMTPFDPRWAHVVELARGGLIGKVQRIAAHFTFTIGPEAATNYRWDPLQGGGALLDVGIYCLGSAFELFGDQPDSADIIQIPAPSGVDARSDVVVTWPSGQVATAVCSFVDDEAQTLDIVGSAGTLSLTHDAHTGGQRARTIDHHDADGQVRHIGVVSDDPYRLMIEAFARSVRGVEPWPRPVERSIAMLDTLTGGLR